jgi:Short C-terminal domain
MIPTGTTGRAAAVLALDWESSLLVAGLYLAGALLLGALVIDLVRRWRREPGPERPTPSDQLAQYRSLYEQGVISQEEFERLRTLLGGELQKSLAVPPRPPPPGGTAVKPAGPSREGGSEPPQNPPENGIRPA